MISPLPERPIARPFPRGTAMGRSFGCLTRLVCWACGGERPLRHASDVDPAAAPSSTGPPSPHGQTARSPSRRQPLAPVGRGVNRGVLLPAPPSVSRRPPPFQSRHDSCTMRGEHGRGGFQHPRRGPHLLSEGPDRKPGRSGSSFAPSPASARHCHPILTPLPFPEASPARTLQPTGWRRAEMSRWRLVAWWRTGWRRCRSARWRRRHPVAHP